MKNNFIVSHSYHIKVDIVVKIILGSAVLINPNSRFGSSLATALMDFRINKFEPLNLISFQLIDLFTRIKMSCANAI